MKNDFLQQARDALTELMQVIGDTEARQRDAAAHAVRLSAKMKRVSELQSQVGEGAPPMLKHYLERRSYAKALALLEMGKPEDESPRCG